MREATVSQMRHLHATPGVSEPRSIGTGPYLHWTVFPTDLKWILSHWFDELV